jgi:hypothetical protein
MKKAILSLLVIILGFTTAGAQVFRIGLKGGPNFANFSGGPGGINYHSRTSLHLGAVAEVGLSPKWSLQPEFLYSSHGAKVDGLGDFNLDYVSVPVLAKIYLGTNKISLEVGPQFSFLVNDARNAFENEKFELGMAGGLGLNITQRIFAQARYTLGLTEASREAEVRNSVFQLSIGYMFL